LGFSRGHPSRLIRKRGFHTSIVLGFASGHPSRLIRNPVFPTSSVVLRFARGHPSRLIRNPGFSYLFRSFEICAWTLFPPYTQSSCAAPPSCYLTPAKYSPGLASPEGPTRWIFRPRRETQDLRPQSILPAWPRPKVQPSRFFASDARPKTYAHKVFSRLGLARRSSPLDFSPPTRDPRLTPAKYSPGLVSPEGPARWIFRL